MSLVILPEQAIENLSLKITYLMMTVLDGLLVLVSETAEIQQNGRNVS